MKYSILSLFSLVAASASSRPDIRLPSSIPANSELGQSLLSSARRLNNNNENEADFTWMTSYSLKFQGCHAHTSLNLQGNNNNNNKNNANTLIQTVKMAHFRLCPTNTCQSYWGSGCSTGYADYVVDLETYAKSYIQSHRRAREYECQLYLLASCDCQESDDRDDNFNREYCEYDCFANSKMYGDCVDRNPYEEEGGERKKRFEPERYMECKELEWESDDDAAGEYFVGPYCSDKGDGVYLGVYTDNACTTFADSTKGRATYKSITSTELPYSTTSLITNDCVSCIEVEDLNRRQDDQQQNDDAYGNDAEDTDELSEQCERLYQSSGKCEGSLAAMEGTANNEACSFIGGIQYTKTNGVVTKKTTAHDVANIFIGLFASAFVAMGAVVYLIRKKVLEKGDASIEKKDSKEKALIENEEKPLDAATSA